MHWHVAGGTRRRETYMLAPLAIQKSQVQITTIQVLVGSFRVNAIAIRSKNYVRAEIGA
jgi:hypothetical protein